MPSVLALLSKSFFETKMRIDGAAPTLGDVAPIDRYLSKTKRLTALGPGDALFLVTVRPPDEDLWLVAVLESPTFEVTHWQAPAANETPVTDISDVLEHLVFDNGKGITAASGRLGMSLQTPRILTAADVALLRRAAAPAETTAPSTAAPTAAQASAPSAEDLEAAAAERDKLLKELRASPEDAALRERAARACIRAGQPARAVGVLTGHFVHLNAHDHGPLPCLCKKCLDADKHAAATDGTEFVRDFAVASGRILYFWLPQDLINQRARVAGSVASSMRHRFRGGRS